MKMTIDGQPRLASEAFAASVPGDPQAPRPPVTVILRPRKWIVWLAAFAALLIAANLIGLAAKFGFDERWGYGFVPLFDLDGERNVPSLFSGLLILSCGVLLSLIALGGRGRRVGRTYWLGLAAIFLFLAVDEVVSLHERLIEPLRAALHTSGVLYFAWLIPYGIAGLLVGVAYARFLFRLPPATRNRMVVAGLVYVAGAAGLEMAGGWYLEQLGGQHNLYYELLTTCEESLEMYGMILFARALLRYMAGEACGTSLLTAYGLPRARLTIDDRR